MSDYMKNVLKYYYLLKDPNIMLINNKIYIKDKNKNYILHKAITIKNLKVQKEIQSLNNKYYKIVPTISKDLYIIYQGKIYCLLELNKLISINDIEKDIFNYEYTYKADTASITRNDWYYLWTSKIDFYEALYNTIKGKYKYIDESIDYYINLSETGLEYYKYNFKNNKKNNLVICRKRMNIDEFYNPLNIVLDHKERDIGEYLKWLFYQNKNDIVRVERVIKKCIEKNMNMELVVSRLLFSTYYFDEIDNIVTNNKTEQNLKLIISKNTEYENYISKIIDKIQEYIDIPNIKYIKKD